MDRALLPSVPTQRTKDAKQSNQQLTNLGPVIALSSVQGDKMSDTQFFYAPAANVTVGKLLRIKGRRDGIVRGILTADYKYLTSAGATSHIAGIFRVCLQFYDIQEGACLNCARPTDFYLVRGWGTYLPRGRKEHPWQELH
jgi:hypothetical protein